MPAPAAIVGPGNLLASPSDLVVYECDGYTIEKNKPDVVVFPTTTEQVVEIVKMSDAGADATVIQAYVENSTIAYTPRSEEIIYLHEHGIPDCRWTPCYDCGVCTGYGIEHVVASPTPPAGGSQGTGQDLSRGDTVPVTLLPLGGRC